MTQPQHTHKHPKGIAWHNQTAKEVLAQLGTTATGLSAPEAAQRLATNGPNELKKGKHISALQIFLGQFKSLIIWILIVAGIVSGVLGEMVADDGVVISTYLEQIFDKAKLQSIAEIREALVQGGLKRIRANLMTIATTVFGLMPVFWATGRGADVMKPIASLCSAAWR